MAVLVLPHHPLLGIFMTIYIIIYYFLVFLLLTRILVLEVSSESYIAPILPF